MAKAKYKTEEDLKKAKEKMPILGFRRMKEGQVSVDLKNKKTAIVLPTSGKR